MFHPLYPRWFSGKESSSKAADLGSVSRFAVDLLPGQVMPVTSNLALQLLPCQVSGAIGSALRMVGPVSVYCD